MRRKVVYSIIIIMLALTGCTIGGSFLYVKLLIDSECQNLSKDADSYPFMYKKLPFFCVHGWIA